MLQKMSLQIENVDMKKEHREAWTSGWSSGSVEFEEYGAQGAWSSRSMKLKSMELRELGN